MKEKIKDFWNKHKGKIALGAVTLGTGLVAFKLFGKNREMAGQIENLNHQVNGLQKTIERQSYVIGKQNQKLYGGKSEM